jgi:SPX domain protein involved in polyphosphate accumulation
LNQVTYRHEYKHTINLMEYHTIRQRLKVVTQPDPHANSDGRYHIRSLYFDNDEDKALKEKYYGLPKREKYRIRLYNYDENYIRLEKKSKIDSVCSKQAVTLSRAQTEMIISGSVSGMSQSQDPVLLEFFTKMVSQRLRPKTLVDYWREAYVYPYGNVRITFDMDIRTGLLATGLFDSETPMVQVLDSGLVLLEVKYDNFLPDIIRDLIQTNTRQTSSYSKYAASRIYC